MNISLQNGKHAFAGLSQGFGGGLMKSTAQKLERQAKRDSQVAFFENQKKNLKNIQCSSPEEVARVLELLHSYEDQIAAAKAEYNNAQMMHLMDEAKERGEEIAKAIEKSEPKTEEERKKEAVEEALGIDEGKGLLSDILDQVTEEAAKALEDMSEAQAPPDQTAQAPLDQEPAQAAQASPDQEPAQAAEVLDAAVLLKPQDIRGQEMLPEYPAAYKRFDAFA